MNEQFRHGAFLASLVILLVAWKFGIESIVD